MRRISLAFLSGWLLSEPFRSAKNGRCTESSSEAARAGGLWGRVMLQSGGLPGLVLQRAVRLRMIA